MFGQWCLDGLIFGFGLGFGLIASLFIQKGVIFWWVSSKNEKALRDKMLVTSNLKGVNHILVLS